MDEYLKSVGYSKSKADECIYVKSVKEANGHISFVILGVYVDDIIPVSNDPAMLKVEKAALCERFEMIDHGEICYLLGLSIKRDRESRTLTISQPNYIEKCSESLEWRTANLSLLLLSLEESLCSYLHMMSPLILRPINRQLDV